jgi:hypothetical protein
VPGVQRQRLMWGVLAVRFIVVANIVNMNLSWDGCGIGSDDIGVLFGGEERFRSVGSIS